MLLLSHLLNMHKMSMTNNPGCWSKGNVPNTNKVSPEDGVIGQLTEALAHTRCTTQVLLQQVREDL